MAPITEGRASTSLPLHSPATTSYGFELVGQRDSQMSIDREADEIVGLWTAVFGEPPTLRTDAPLMIKVLVEAMAPLHEFGADPNAPLLPGGRRNPRSAQGGRALPCRPVSRSAAAASGYTWRPAGPR